MNFEQLIAKYVSGNLPLDQIPEISLVAFEEGYDSPSLWILAGLEKSEDGYIKEKYLKLALDEMGINFINKREATLTYLNAIAEDVISGKSEIINGVSEMVSIIKNGDFYLETKKYVYDSIFFEHIYGLYDAYDDIVDVTVEWSEDKSNKDLIIEVKQNLLLELKKWNEKCSSFLQRNNAYNQTQHPK